MVGPQIKWCGERSEKMIGGMNGCVKTQQLIRLSGKKINFLKLFFINSF